MEFIPWHGLQSFGEMWTNPVGITVVIGPAVLRRLFPFESVSLSLEILANYHLIW